ncbi:putative Ribosomal protein s17 [Seiridium cardinale]|uniref:Ribosomal protein s17 n=1 Tax=Seiridium cardinale TaxID=138064 RepID=A0ABR2Y5H2_9PEZI
MLVKSVLVGLLSLSLVAEASVMRSPFDKVLHQRAGRTRSLQARQNGKAGKGGNQGGNRNGGNNAGAQASATTAATNTATAAAANNNNNNNNNNNGGNNNAAAASSCLSANALQTGSAQDGSDGAEAGQANSATDANNFINFCAGETLTNGLQQKQGSCNGIPMGKMPASTKMISAVFVNPQNGDNIAANTDFSIQVQMANLAAGTFTNPDSTYYSAPQDLDNTGIVIGHTHVSVQDTGNSLNPTQPLDASQFAFFKGINDAGNGNGLLAADVAGGLPAGNYRVCSMTGAANHQPVLMPVAQRGPQDDCVRFTVGGNNNANANAGNANANTGNANAGNTGNAGSTATVSGAVAGATAPAVTASGNEDRPFEVNGNTFVNEAAAKQRSCDIQFNACADAVNGGQASGVTVSDCQAQQTSCLGAAS